MNIEIGSIVLSKAGRDSGNYFIVVKQEKEFAYIVDGGLRKVEKPKKKKLKHLSSTKETHEVLKDKFLSGKKVFDSEVKSALRVIKEKLIEGEK